MYQAFQKLEKAGADGKHLCVGLDPGKAHIAQLMGVSEEFVRDRLYAWAHKLVRVTGPYAAAYKANYGFWWHSPETLRNIFKDIRKSMPEVTLILDAKTGDIDNTSDQWTELANFVEADAVTISPYMGVIDVTASASKAGIGCFVTARTSNPGSAQLQERKVSVSENIAVSVAQLVAMDTDALEHGIVVGATHIQELEDLEKAFPNTPFLIPGVGKQGGDLEKVIAIMSKHKAPWIVNNGRGIAEAGKPGQSIAEWQEAAGAAAKSYHEKLRAA